MAVLVAGLGLAGALALGWRSPIPRRPPDWQAADVNWELHGEGWLPSAEAGLQVQIAGPGRRAWALAPQQLADFEVELEVTALSANEDTGYGLVYHYRDAANYYLFTIGGDGYYAITAVRNGETVPLREWEAWPHVRRGAATNRLRIRCLQALCRFYVNDEFTAEIDMGGATVPGAPADRDPSPGSGQAPTGSRAPDGSGQGGKKGATVPGAPAEGITLPLLDGRLGVWAQTFSDDRLDLALTSLRVWSLNRSALH